MKARGNELTAALEHTYRRTPKAVWAAIAYAFASELGATDDPKSIEYAIAMQWRALRDAGVVSQRVKIPRAVLDSLRQRDLFPA